MSFPKRFFILFFVHIVNLPTVRPDLFNYATSKVIKLDQNTFHKKVFSKTSEIWMVFFFSHWLQECRNFTGPYDAAASALHGIMKLGALNVDENPELGKAYNLTKSHLKVFGLEYHPLDYSGPKTADAILDFAIKAVDRKIGNQLTAHEEYLQKKGVPPPIHFFNTAVVEISDVNYRDIVKKNSVWFFLFYTTDSELSKTVAVMWRKAADELKRRVNFGAIDVAKNEWLRRYFNVTEFPSIRHMRKGNSQSLRPMHQFKATSSFDIVQYALNANAQNKVDDLIQLTDYTAFEQECGNQQLCIVAYLPRISDCNKQCRLQYLAIFRKVIDKYKTLFWGWLWSEGGAQPALENSLDVGGVGYPVTAIIYIEKRKYSKIVGAFTFDTMNNVLKNVNRVKGVPAYDMETNIDIYPVKPWDEEAGYDDDDDEDFVPEEPVGTLWDIRKSVEKVEKVTTKNAKEKSKARNEEL